jgi:hypothetical protein
VTLVLTVEYAKVVEYFLFLILGGVWAFVSLRAAWRNRLVTDEEGLIIRREHDTRLYWHEIQEVRPARGGWRARWSRRRADSTFDFIDAVLGRTVDRGADPNPCRRRVRKERKVSVDPNSGI